MNDAIHAEIRQLLQRARRFLLLSHLRPDGDAVGSLLALGLSLQKAGKETQLVLEDGLPRALNFLPGSDQIRHTTEGSFDAIIIVDCSEIDRVGKIRENFPAIHLNIDHHITNTQFARLNWVEPSAAATAEMLAKALPAWGLAIDREIATALLTGLLTDTIGFRTSSVTPATLQIAAELIELGADLHELQHKALHTRSFEAARYWGTGLINLQREDRLIWTTLTTENRNMVNYPGRDDADLTNLLQTVEDADVYIVFVEQPNRRVKVSWRARAGFDVSKIAVQFGGGGHQPAAGAEIDGSLEEVKSKVLPATRSILNGKGTHSENHSSTP